MKCPPVRSDLRKLRDFNTSLYEAENVTPSRLEVEHWRLLVTMSHHCRCWLAGSDRPSRVCRIAAPSNQTASGRNYYNLELNETQLLTAFRKSCFCAKTQLPSKNTTSCAELCNLGQCCVYQVLGCAFFTTTLCLSCVQWCAIFVLIGVVLFKKHDFLNSSGNHDLFQKNCIFFNWAARRSWWKMVAPCIRVWTQTGHSHEPIHRGPSPRCHARLVR